MYECVCFKCNKSFFAESKRAGICQGCKVPELVTRLREHEVTLMQEAADEIERLRKIEATARELIGPEGMRLTMSQGHLLAVIERPDKSDPHYRLCNLRPSLSSMQPPQVMEPKMQLYRACEDNGAAEPWNMENIWCFDINLQWQQWLFGISRYPDYAGVVWTFCFGPLVANYYHQK